MFDSWRSSSNPEETPAEKVENGFYGWTIPNVYAAAALIGNQSMSAANATGNMAKQCWNSEAVANSTSAVRNYTGTAASYVGEGVKNLYGYYGSKNEEKSENLSEQETLNGGRGAAVGITKNAAQYVVKTSGRATNIVNFYDKTKISSLGNPKWFARVDKPHGLVNYHHINVNPAITGKPDPHIRISPTTAATAGYLGKAAEKINQVAPYITAVVAAYEVYQIGKEAQKDYEHGTTRNTIQKVATTTGTYTAGYLGANAGASMGTMVFPGVGTFFGGIGGGIAGAVYGGHAAAVATEMTLDHNKWDTQNVKCTGCNTQVEWKKYQNKSGECNGCQHKSHL